MDTSFSNPYETGTWVVERAARSLQRRSPVASSSRASSEPVRRAARLDGRQARAAHTHRSVLEGLRECLREGDLEPTARVVASKAGVSLRAVFRHFHHLDRLFAEVFHLEYERFVGAERRLSTSGSLEDRIRRIVTQRARRHERLSPVRRAGQRFESTSGVLLREYESVRRRERDEVATLFAAELGAMSPSGHRDVIATISAALSWAVWEELRRHERLSSRAARAAQERLLSSALTVSRG